MTSVDLIPTSLREAGTEIATVAMDFQTGILESMLALNGAGEHMSFSQFGYPPGSDAAEIAGIVTGEWGDYCVALISHIQELSSILHTLADVFSGTESASAEDVNNVVNYIDNPNPNAARPANLPWYIDPDVTSLNDEGEFVPDDDVSALLDPSLENNGTTISETTIVEPGSHVTHRTTTEFTDSDGNVVTTQHYRIEHVDGTVEYYSRNGDTGETYGHFEVESQPNSMTLEEIIEDLRSETEEAEEEIRDF